MAALSVSSRRLPGMTQGNVLPIASIRAAATTAIELPHLETFPGAACYQPIELPGYKAAPLQSVRCAQPAACLRPCCVRFASFKRSDVSELLSSLGGTGPKDGRCTNRIAARWAYDQPGFLNSLYIRRSESPLALFNIHGRSETSLYRAGYGTSPFNPFQIILLNASGSPRLSSLEKSN
jgi:hypothetical protein